MRARLIGGLPADLVGSLTGLTQGHFPVHAKARYADDASTPRRPSASRRANAALPVTSSATPPGHQHLRQGRLPRDRHAGRRASCKMGQNKRLGKFLMLRDVYGNTYTYARLKKLAAYYPVPKQKTVSSASVNKELKLPKADPAPTPGRRPPASRSPPHAAAAKPAPKAAPKAARRQRADDAQGAPVRQPVAPRRLQGRRRAAAPERRQLDPGYTTYKSYFTRGLRPQALRRAAEEAEGRQQGHRRHDPRPPRPHRDRHRAAHALRAPPRRQGRARASTRSRSSTAGSCSSRPRSTAPRARTRSAGPNAKDPSIGQILLMSKEALQRRVLDRSAHQGLRLRPPRHPRRHRSTAACSPRSSSSTASGLKPTVSALECGHSLLTTSGNVSEHSLRQRRRHRRDQRDPDPRPPGRRLDHRHHDPPAADAAGHDEAPPDHQPHDLRRRRQHAGAARPRRPHPRGLPAARTARTRRPAASSTRCSSPSSGSS